VEFALAAALAAAAVAWNLDASWIVGDELNAIYFLREGFLDYLANFHYGIAIKVQVWVLHHLFGNDFGWYRAPSAVAAVLACACLFLPRGGRPRWDWPVLAGVFLLAFNGPFLFFARWGMPSYAQGIAASALLLGLILRDVQAAPAVRWTAGKLAIIGILPWLYPATIVFLGSISVYFGLAILPLIAGRPSPALVARRILHAGVPLLLGLVSFGLNLGMRSGVDWERARAHHLSFSDWAVDTGGSRLQFLFEGLKGLAGDFAATATGAAAAAETPFQQAYQVVLLLVAAIVAVAPLIALRMRDLPGMGPATRGFLRGAALLAVIPLATLGVTFAASLFDAFPIGKVRYVFFLLPTLAFLAVLSLGYCAWALERRAPAAARGIAVAASIGLLALAALGLRTLVQDRAAAEKRQHALLSALTATRNHAVVNWDPGFFLPPALLPDGTSYFHVGADRRLPAGLVPSVAKLPAAPLRRVAFFSRNGRLLEPSGTLVAPLRRFSELTGYQLEERVDGGSFQVLVFAPAAEAGRRAVDAALDLPPVATASIRIQPAGFADANIAFTRLALEWASGETLDIDLCGDRRLQLVRTRKLQRTRDGACLLRFGNADGPGWMVPTALRTLPAGPPRRLHIEAEGDLGPVVNIYLDIGRGYGSKDMLVVQAAPAAPPVSGP